MKKAEALGCEQTCLWYVRARAPGKPICGLDSRGSCTRCDHGEDVNGTLVTPDTYFRLIRAKSNTVNLRLIRSASQLACLLPSSRIPYADQRSSNGGRREQPPRWRHGKGRDGCVVRHDNRMRRFRRLWWWGARGGGRWWSDGDGRRTGREVYELHVSGLPSGRRQQRRVCTGGNGDDTCRVRSVDVQTKPPGSVDKGQRAHLSHYHTCPIHYISSHCLLSQRRQPACGVPPQASHGDRRVP
jgi:hypothetical protein